MYTLRLFFALAITCTSALHKVRTEANLREVRGESVCISLVAFEDPQFVDLVLANVLAFTERSTKIALHLNANSEYTTEQLATWNASDRLVVTTPRVAVERFKGSVFTAHLSNAWAIENRWPGQCGYYVMQSSNMLWVRPGLEPVVRKSGFAQIFEIAKAQSKAGSHKFYGYMLKKGRGLHAESHPEGAFYPMRMVLSFSKFFMGYLASVKEDLDSVSNFPAYFEASWLQTYAVNFEDPPPIAENLRDTRWARTLCYRAIWTPAKFLKDGHDSDSIKLKRVLHVVNAEDHYEQYYSVKRVARDVRHPVTKYIADLTFKRIGSNRQLLSGKLTSVYKNLAEMVK